VNDLERSWSPASLQKTPRSGRPRKLQRVDRITKTKSPQDFWKAVTTIARELSDKGFANVSRMTVSRRLGDMGLFDRIGAKKSFISAKNKKARLEFAMEHRNWTIRNWKEMRFWTNLNLTFKNWKGVCQTSKIFPDLLNILFTNCEVRRWQHHDLGHVLICYFSIISFAESH
jgi:hypothetical protein